MCRSGWKAVLAPFVLTIVLLGASAPAEASLVVNGDFTQGLTGWTVTPAGSVVIVGQEAILYESSTAMEVDLYQDFTIPTGATTLTFTIASLTTEPGSFFLPDALGISLMDPVTLTSLVGVAQSGTESFYTRDLVDGVTEGLVAPGVVLSPSGTALPLNFTLDISSLANQDVRLLFRLIGGGDAYDATVGVANVRVNGGGGGGGGGGEVVPEPSTLVMAASALLPLAVYSLRRRFTTKAT